MKSSKEKKEMSSKGEKCNALFKEIIKQNIFCNKTVDYEPY